MLWLSHKPEIQSEMVQHWVNLNDDQRSRIKKMISHEEKMKWVSGTEIMDCLLSAALPDYKSKLKHFMIKADSKLMEQGNLDPGELIDQRYYDDHRYYREMYKANRNIFRGTEEVLNGIDKNIRKRFLAEHKSCVKRFGRDDEFCSYAFVYVFWKQFIEGLRNYNDVNYQYYRNQPSRAFQHDFADKQDGFVLQHFLSRWNERERQFKGLEAQKWVINRVMQHLAMNHFYNWIRHAKYLHTKKELGFREYYRPPFGYTLVPFFVIKPPTDGSPFIEFHWWTDNPISIDQIDLPCPYDSVAKRRKKHNIRYQVITSTSKLNISLIY